MAREGILTAIQAALAGVGGGIEGARQYRTAEAEKKRMADAASRQTRMDTAAQEDRAEAKADRLRNQRQSLLAGGYIPTGRDMPGATPRQAVNTETVDGQDFALYSTPRQLAMQAALEAAELKAKFKPDTMTPYEAERIRQSDLDRASREKIAAGRASTGASGGAGGMKPPTATDATKEAQGIKFLNKNRTQEVMLALQKSIEVNPALANRPGLIGYGLMQLAEREARASASPKGGGRAPRSGNAPPGAGGASATASQTETDDLEAAYTQYKRK